MVRASIDGYCARAEEQGAFHSIFWNIQREVWTLRINRMDAEKNGDKRTDEEFSSNDTLPPREWEEHCEAGR